MLKWGNLYIWRWLPHILIMKKRVASLSVRPASKEDLFNPINLRLHDPQLDIASSWLDIPISLPWKHTFLIIRRISLRDGIGYRSRCYAIVASCMACRAPVICRGRNCWGRNVGARVIYIISGDGSCNWSGCLHTERSRFFHPRTRTFVQLCTSGEPS